jgi:tRNA dimethylallyltransferase
VGEYAPLAHAAIDEILGIGRVPIVVGGSGLYFRAALERLSLPPKPAPGARERWAGVYDADPGAAYLRLREMDAAAAERVHVNDRRRVIRALELAEAGTSLIPIADELWSPRTRLPTVVVGVDVPPDELERRIVARTDAMFEAGVHEEVRHALSNPVSQTAERALGLHAIATMPTDLARAFIVRRTLALASYQRKWMRRIPGLVMVESADDVVALVSARE